MVHKIYHQENFGQVNLSKYYQPNNIEPYNNNSIEYYVNLLGDILYKQNGKLSRKQKEFFYNVAKKDYQNNKEKYDRYEKYTPLLRKQKGKLSQRQKEYFISIGENPDNIEEFFGYFGAIRRAAAAAARRVRAAAIAAARRARRIAAAAARAAKAAARRARELAEAAARKARELAEAAARKAAELARKAKEAAQKVWRDKAQRAFNAARAKFAAMAKRGAEARARRIRAMKIREKEKRRRKALIAANARVKKFKMKGMSNKDMEKPDWNAQKNLKADVDKSVGQPPKIDTKISKVPTFKHKSPKNPNPDKVKADIWESFTTIYENFQETKYVCPSIYIIVILLTLLAIHMITN